MKNLTESATDLLRHLHLPGGEWSLWRQVGLRGAGFPAHLVLDLGFPDLASAARRVREAEERLERSLDRARGEVDSALDSLRENGEWDDKKKVRPLLKALRALNKGKLSAAVVASVSGAVIEEVRRAETELAAIRDSYANSYEEALVRQSEVIHGLANMPRFREAVLWQNRSAFHTGLEPLARESPKGAYRDTQRRQHEEMAASYLQRYAVKNDTIGFFGPMGWARLVDDGPAIDVRPGKDLIRARGVFLESWCFEALAASLSRQPAMRPWLTPRLLSSFRLEGTELFLDFREARRLSPVQAAALRLCDGQRSANGVARELIRGAELSGEEEVYELLEEFRVAGWIDWDFYVPIGPESREVLERQIDRIEDSRLKKIADFAMTAMERARDQVAAAGSAEELDRALTKLDGIFQKITGAAATRDHGRVYAGRTLIFEDCVRDVEVEIGPDVLRAIDKPLSLILQGARWFTTRAAMATRELFRKVYRELVRQEGKKTIGGVRYWKALRPHFHADESPYMEEARREVHARWSEIFNLDPARRRVEISSDDIRERVKKAFECPAAGWEQARYHNPDVMIVAESVNAFKRGDYHLVLGEMHVAMNTLNSWTFLRLSPEREEIFANIERDLTDCVSLKPPRDFPGVTTRTQIAYTPSGDTVVPAPDDSMISFGPRTVPLSSLGIEDHDGELVVRSIDGEIRFGVEELFATLNSNHVGANYSFLPAADHWPRISIDRMIVCRECWSFELAGFEFADCRDASERFLKARLWAEGKGLPRFVFVSTPGELKPFYVDFASPIYVDILAKSIRRDREVEGADARIKFSEMVPGFDELWLPDAEGKLYCCEFRIVVVDQLRRVVGKQTHPVAWGSINA